MFYGQSVRQTDIRLYSVVHFIHCAYW